MNLRGPRLPGALEIFILLAGILFSTAGPAPIAVFDQHILTDQYYCDGIQAGDINRDQKMDIVAGPFWYAGPDFKTKHAFYPDRVFETAPSPTDSMFTYIYDFNGDEWPDILVFGRVHLHEAFWYENPHNQPGLWRKHFVFHRIQGESPPFLDADGDGKPEIVAHWENRWGFIQPDWNHPTNAWTFKPITSAGNYHHFYHGTGVGDVNGDGRSDLILNEGWFEQPAKPDHLWMNHPFQFADKGGAQMFAMDVDGDSDHDIITALDAHGWGLAWFEHVKTQNEITFRKHVIMGDRSQEKEFGAAFSQPHALAVADIDGDGLPDLVTGKRRWAHGPTGDIEPMADPVLYWFQLVRPPSGPARYVPHLINAHSGLGVQITVTDVNGDSRPDLLAASKLGSFVFFNRLALP